MVMYDRSTSDEARIVAESDRFVSWLAHPDERGKRASHALRTDEGVWLVDPLDAPNVDDAIDGLGDVAGIAVLSAYHARDAGVLARRYDVAVHVPEWMNRVEERVDGPVERYTDAPGGPDAGFRTYSCRPFPGWQEVFLYHEPSRTLFSPDSLGTCEQNCIGEERLGLVTVRRLQPPDQLRGLEPDRVLVGHGEPVTADATAALETALDGGPRTFPKAFLKHGPESVRSVLAALR